MGMAIPSLFIQWCVVRCLCTQYSKVQLVGGWISKAESKAPTYGLKRAAAALHRLLVGCWNNLQLMPQFVVFPSLPRRLRLLLSIYSVGVSLLPNLDYAKWCYRPEERGKLKFNCTLFGVLLLHFIAFWDRLSIEEEFPQSCCASRITGPKNDYPYCGSFYGLNGLNSLNLVAVSLMRPTPWESCLCLESILGVNCSFRRSLTGVTIESAIK